MLYILDLDGTTIVSYLSRTDKDFYRVEVLPSRKETIAELRAAGHRFGIATNQAGVAFTWKDQPVITEDDVWDKVRRALEDLGLPLSTPVAVCFAHPKSRDERYCDPRAIRRRKPCGAMLLEVMAEAGVTDKSQVVMVGDMESDQGAADDAGVAFVSAREFFGDDERERVAEEKAWEGAPV